MKTAISVPDKVFDRVEKRVKALGMSRSEFYARAAERYLEDLDGEGLTARIDAAIAAAPVSGDEQSEWTRAGLASVDAATRDDEW